MASQAATKASVAHEIFLEEQMDFGLGNDEVDEEELVKQRTQRLEKINKLQAQLDKEKKVKAATENMLQLYMGNLEASADRDFKLQLDSTNAKIQQLTKQLEALKSEQREAALAMTSAAVMRKSFVASGSMKPTMPLNSNPLSGSDSQQQHSDYLRSGSESYDIVSLRKANSVNQMPQSWRFRLSHFRAETVEGVKVRKRPALNVMKGVLQNVSDLLERVKLKEETLQNRLDTLNSLAKLIKSGGNIEQTEYVESILHTMKFCLCMPVSELRAAAYRVIRYLLREKDTLDKFWQMGFEVFLLRTLARESKEKDVRSDVEREQALRLVRSVMEINSAEAIVIPRSIVCILGAMAEQVEDRLRIVALETLCELALRSPKQAASTGTLRFVFQSLLDGPSRLLEIVMPVVTNLMDLPENRQFVQPDIDIDMAISVFTDAYSKGQNQEERLKACSRSIILLLRSWTGLMYACSRDLYVIRCLVDAMRLPFDDVKKVLIDLLLEVFHCKKSFVHNSRDSFVTFERANLLDHHLSLVLVVFVEAGLLECLMDIIELNISSPINTKATQLLGDLVFLSNKLLPSKLYSMRVQSLTKLFSMAATFVDETQRHLGTSTLIHIDSSVLDAAQEDQSVSITQLHHIKLRIGVDADELQLKQLLQDSQVLISKDYTKWNWDIIDELLQGVLLNPKRLDETIKSTKFIRRLLTYFRPRKLRFSNLKPGKNTMRFLNSANSLLRTLLNSTEGIKVLVEHKFLHEVRSCLTELDPMVNSSNSADLTFSKERMDTTMTCEYISFLGLLSSFDEGIGILEKLKYFDLFYHLTELKSRDDIIFRLIEKMDYKADGHNRIILSKVLTSGYKHVRLFATNFLRTLLNQTSFFSSSPSSADSEWIVKLLINQLYDPALDVCERAAIILDEACLSSTNLRILIEEKPYLDHLRELANPILFRFLSTPLGFYHLKDMNGYLEKELKYWYTEGNMKYVIHVELSLAKSLMNRQKESLSKTMEFKLAEEMAKLGLKELVGVQHMKSMRSVSSSTINQSPVSLSAAAVTSESESIRFEQDGVCLPHFYGELTKTEQGCVFLRSKNHFIKFNDTIAEALSIACGSTSPSPGKILEIKAALWAVGNIGSTKRGLVFLMDHNTLSHIMQLIERCTILSIKGTCFYVIGLLSKNPEAAVLLEDYGWFTNIEFDGPSVKPTVGHQMASTNVPSVSRINTDVMTATGVGLAVPSRLRRLFTIPEWVPSPLVNDSPDILSLNEELFLSDDPTERDILKNVGSLSNHVLANAASKSLNKLKQENTSYFANAELYVRCLKIVSVYRYRLTARRFINDLFDAVDLEDVIGEVLPELR